MTISWILLRAHESNVMSSNSIFESLDTSSEERCLRKFFVADGIAHVTRIVIRSRAKLHTKKNIGNICFLERILQSFLVKLRGIPTVRQ